MKRGASGFTVFLRYNPAIRCHFQPVALDQTLDAALLTIPFDLGLMIVVVAERLVDLGGG
ncbi:MAG: hypothetical protein M5U01_40495 [Ardenticatenaceae bacterium]|nr:hypothetical protein [Ardenticatenaceae bacterium]